MDTLMLADQQIPLSINSVRKKDAVWGTSQEIWIIETDNERKSTESMQSKRLDNIHICCILTFDRAFNQGFLGQDYQLKLPENKRCVGVNSSRGLTAGCGFMCVDNVRALRKNIYWVALASLVRQSLTESRPAVPPVAKGSCPCTSRPRNRSANWGPEYGTTWQRRYGSM